MNLLPAFAGTPHVNRVYHVDALTLLGAMPDQSVDAVICDPPYGMGLEEWDKPIDIPAFIRGCERILKPTGFLAFFIQMPFLVNWCNSLLNTTLLYHEHVVWAKRNIGVNWQGLHRTHESFLIYRKKDAKYFQTKGNYADVKIPLLDVGGITEKAFGRYIKDLHIKVRGGTPSQTLHNSRNHQVFSHIKYPGNRSPEYCNFTNLWSFTPENNRHKNNKCKTWHPTAKPLKFVERACELLTPPNALILDPVCGSGTTGIAARNTGRNFIMGDITLEYVDVARKRLALPFTIPMFESHGVAG